VHVKYLCPDFHFTVSILSAFHPLLVHAKSYTWKRNSKRKIIKPWSCELCTVMFCKREICAAHCTWSFVRNEWTKANNAGRIDIRFLILHIKLTVRHFYGDTSLRGDKKNTVVLRNTWDDRCRRSFLRDCDVLNRACNGNGEVAVIRRTFFLSEHVQLCPSSAIKYMSLIFKASMFS